MRFRHGPQAWGEEVVYDTPQTLQALLLAMRAEDACTCKLPPDAEISIPDAEIRTVPRAVCGTPDLPGLLRTVFPIPAGLAIAVFDANVPRNNGVFDLNGNSVTAAPQLRLSAGRMVQLVIGYCTPMQLRQAGCLDVLDEAAFARLSDCTPACPCYIADEY